MRRKRQNWDGWCSGGYRVPRGWTPRGGGAGAGLLVSGLLVSGAQAAQEAVQGLLQTGGAGFGGVGLALRVVAGLLDLCSGRDLAGGLPRRPRLLVSVCGHLLPALPARSAPAADN